MPSDATAPRMGAPEWIALLALSTLWGGSFFFFKVLVAELPPFTVVLGRVGIAAWRSTCCWRRGATRCA